MRIKYLAFCLTLALSFNVLNGHDDDVEEFTNHFIKERLVPLLRQAQEQPFDLDRLRICKCSPESGCTLKTSGYLPKVVGLLPNETEHFELTCFTDGKCFQKAWPHPLNKHYGCVDLGHPMSKEVYDNLHVTCQNKTEEHSICCDDGNFCANRTLLYVPPVLSTWFITAAIISSIVAIVFVIVFGSLVCFVHKYKLKRFSLKAACKDNQEMDEVENNGNNENGQNNHFNDISATFQTMSTSVGDEYTPELQTQAINMILALEETSGSGSGPSMLHQSTIGNQVTIHGKIGSGGFGSVSRGTYRGEQVAVKIFKSSDESAYYKEVAIYETNMLRHTNVLRYIGSDRVEVRQKTEMWLVTEYHPSGSLHDFLEKNIINLDTWYSLMRSAANGLDFLHCAVPGITKFSNKPSIAHRDIKSRNIMVKHDLTCAIGDLGLSLSSFSQKIDLDGVSLRCGTVRYLAPEILEETIQAENFESYLMADVYALALVMWEALCRTEEEEIQARDAATVLPYFEWSDRDPTDAQMKDIVCTRNLRPTEDPGWGANPDFKQVLELITTCWHANPTARFSSLQTRVRLDNLTRKRKANANLTTAASLAALGQDTPRKAVRTHKEFEMNNLAPRGTKVHDQETVENRSGQYRGKDEMKDPLLGC